mmetsp:Transcript_65267/g.164519  ORF Transcript_65267/g.164519 Transcript_65267/m.164519 type:complete len:245 (+) Transcript_65267:427-1161(+)
MIRNIVEAFLLGGQRKVGIGFCQDALRHVRVGHLSVGEVLLLIRELHNNFFVLSLSLLLGLIRLVFLGLLFLAIPLPLGSLARLLCLLFFFLQDALALLLCSLLLPLEFDLVFLLCEDDILDLGLVLSGRLAHDDCSGLLEVGKSKLREGILALVGQEIRPQFRHNEILACHGRDVAEEALNRHVVHLPDAEFHVRLVVRRPLIFGTPQPTLGCPFQDFAVAELDIPRILFQERVNPIEVALVW